MNLIDAFDRTYYALTLNELRMMNQTPARPELSYNTMLYLHLIVYKEDCTVSFLASALHVSKPAVTAKVNELRRLGLVEKRQSETDKRVYYLRPTPQVQQDYQLYDSLFYRALERAQAAFGPEENKLFSQMLQTFCKEFSKIETEEYPGAEI